MRVVSNAPPLIFLAKYGRLELLAALLGREVVVPDLVRDEVLASPVTPAEQRRLERFLSGCRVVTAAAIEGSATALSAADNAVVTVAQAEEAGRVLADERLLREVLAAERIPVLGTLGVLLKALGAGLVTPAQARATVEHLVTVHGFRISVALYARVVAEIAGPSAFGRKFLPAFGRRPASVPATTV
jgi:predicted nucleic acid-binding protein